MKKKILESQKELLNIKVNQINQVQRGLNQTRVNFSETVSRMKIELGIPKEEIGDWIFDKDENFFVKVEKPKEPKGKIPGKK